MTDQEAVRNLHEAIDDTTIFYYDAPREAAHAALAALVAERDALKEAAEEWEQYEREGTAEWQRIVAKHRENTAQAVAERDRNQRKVDAYDSARAVVKIEGNSRAYYVLRAENAEEIAEQAVAERDRYRDGIIEAHDNECGCEDIGNPSLCSMSDAAALPLRDALKGEAG